MTRHTKYKAHFHKQRLVGIKSPASGVKSLIMRQRDEWVLLMFLVIINESLILTSEAAHEDMKRAVNSNVLYTCSSICHNVPSLCRCFWTPLSSS